MKNVTIWISLANRTQDTEASDLGVQRHGDKQEPQDNKDTLSPAGSWGSTNDAESTRGK